MSTLSFEQKVNFLKRDKFIRATNTGSFNDLTSETKSLLSEIGVYSDELNYPYLIANKMLERFDERYIQFGVSDIGIRFCIDMQDNEKIVGIDEEVGVLPINTSLKAYIECLYCLYYYSREIEGKNILGNYYTNRRRYAQKLLEMFNEVEGDITKFSIWDVQVRERDLGVL